MLWNLFGTNTSKYNKCTQLSSGCIKFTETLLISYVFIPVVDLQRITNAVTEQI